MGSTAVRPPLRTPAERPPCGAWSWARATRPMFVSSSSSSWATPIFMRSGRRLWTASRSWCSILPTGSCSSGRQRTRIKEGEVAVQTKVKLLTDSDLPYDELVPGLELARAITSAGSTQLGGGYMRFAQDAEFADWTLAYDEVLLVQVGELTVVSDGESTVARAGEAILIPKCAKGTYLGRAGTASFFVLWPFDWNTKVDRLTKGAGTGRA